MRCVIDLVYCKTAKKFQYDVFTDENNFFNTTASTTYKQGDGEFFLGYIGESVKGAIGIDTVSVN